MLHEVKVLPHMCFTKQDDSDNSSLFRQVQQLNTHVKSRGGAKHRIGFLIPGVLTFQSFYVLKSLHQRGLKMSD